MHFPPLLSAVTVTFGRHRWRQRCRRRDWVHSASTGVCFSPLSPVFSECKHRPVSDRSDFLCCCSLFWVEGQSSDPSKCVLSLLHTIKIHCACIFLSGKVQCVFYFPFHFVQICSKFCSNFQENTLFPYGGRSVRKGGRVRCRIQTIIWGDVIWGGGPGSPWNRWFENRLLCLGC